MEFKRILISGEALVLAFDMCSSSDMLEALILRGDTRPYTYVISKIKERLAELQKTILFDPYKFTGDGWILLFPALSDGAALFELLQDLSSYYRTVSEAHLLPRLDTRPEVHGLTFGIDVGPIVKTTIFQQKEYVGRPINVACRLQSAVATVTKRPAYRALVSSTAYDRYFAALGGTIKVANKTTSLRNIRGGRGFRCQLMQLEGRKQSK